VAHRNAFYHLAGGDEKRRGGHQFPNMLLAATLAVLRGETYYAIFQAVETSLQVLAKKVRIEIELETTNFKKPLRP
jgi:hypothetical protein